MDLTGGHAGCKGFLPRPAGRKPLRHEYLFGRIGPNGRESESFCVSPKDGIKMGLSADVGQSEQ